jgi:pseudoazurin
MNIRNLLIASSMSLMALAPAFAAEHEVKMLNSGETGRMVFEPAFLQIDVGDTVTFVATDPGHNVEYIKDAFPEGAELVKSKLGETISVTFDIAGAYAYKCAPHLGMGMVGMVVVGEVPGNIEQVTAAVSKLPKKPRELFEGWFEEIE